MKTEAVFQESAQRELSEIKAKINETYADNEKKRQFIKNQKLSGAEARSYRTERDSVSDADSLL